MCAALSDTQESTLTLTKRAAGERRLCGRLFVRVTEVSHCGYSLNRTHREQHKERHTTVVSYSKTNLQGRHDFTNKLCQFHYSIPFQLCPRQKYNRALDTKTDLT